MTMAQTFADFTVAARQVQPRVALVLGSGLGFLADRLTVLSSLSYGEVPGLVASTVHGHKGRMTVAKWDDQPLLLLEGRLHYYEGHSWERVARPVLTAAELGARIVLHTNAAGGIHDALEPGSLMALTDHMELAQPFWWRQPGPGGLGPTRPSPYSPRLLAILDHASRKSGVPLHHGRYAALSGPSYETPAEILALKHWGADAVGMSTAREVAVGTAAGLECAALSLITNRAAGLASEPLNHEEVVAMANRGAETVIALLEVVLTEVMVQESG
jgi:purine-nucleoside phosphorylase